MTDEEFNKQYDRATVRGEFAQAVERFVVNDETALAALQELHERLQALTHDYDCPKRLYYLSEDVCSLLNEADEYYKATGEVFEGNFKDDEEIRERTETI